MNLLDFIVKKKNERRNILRKPATARLALAAAALWTLLALAQATPVSSSPQGLADSSRWRVDLSGNAAAVPSHSFDCNLLAAYGWDLGLGAEYAVTIGIPLRVELDYLNVGDSAWDSSLFRYRGFWGLKFAALSGWRFLLSPVEAEILAGGALTAARYTSLSSVTAYPSIVGELRCLFPFRISNLKFGAILGLPIEYMFRGTARTLSAGLEAGISVQLPEAKKK
ncbi:MAG: hypothetical protein NT061_01885 [Spirochaetes bacterium]|nr:hypothetical protein [Spirochaetota bacterium]